MFTLFLLAAYPITVQSVRGGWWVLLSPLHWLTVKLDILVNLTEMSLIYGSPNVRGERFTDRLWGLDTCPGWRGKIAHGMLRWVDWCNPQGFYA